MPAESADYSSKEPHVDNYSDIVDGEESADVWGPDDLLNNDKWSPFKVNSFSSSTFADELFGFYTASANQQPPAITARSVHSIVTETSSSSAASTLPFPFYNRPELPHVDEFVLKDKLHYKNLRLLNMYERKSKIMNPLGMTQSDDITQTPFELNSKKDDSASKGRVLQVPSTESWDDFDEGSEMSDGTLSNIQIKQFVQYIMLFLEEETGTIPNGSKKIQGIHYQEMLTALRMHARNANKFSDDMDYIQELLMASFDDLICRSNHTHIEWFDAYSQGVAGGEYKMTINNFNRSIRNMCEQHKLPVWTNADLKVLRLHMCVDGEYEPCIKGVMRAVRKFYTTKEERDYYEAARPIINKIKRLMRSRKHRVIDFFLLIERNLSIPVPPRKLMAAIKQLLVTSDNNNNNELPKNTLNGGESITSNFSVDTSRSSLTGKGPLSRMTNNTNKKITPLAPLEPLSPEMMTRIAVMKENMQNRLHMAASSGGKTHRLKVPGSSPLDKLGTATISFAMKSVVNKMILNPLPIPIIVVKVSPSDTLGSSMNSTSTSSQGKLELVLKSTKKSPKATFNLSPSFPSVVEQRTQLLVSNLKQYDQKREHNLSLLAALY